MGHRTFITVDAATPSTLSRFVGVIKCATKCFWLPRVSAPVVRFGADEVHPVLEAVALKMHRHSTMVEVSRRLTPASRIP